MTIYGGASTEDSSVELLERTVTNVMDNATYNEKICVKNYEINNSAIISNIKLELEKGGNVSLFWAKVKGLPRYVKDKDNTKK